ncbi:hypothetical protein [Peribacillus acanthi]|uniref:hypothetical protein n=1 Tax=Peribacillus acanthi TaxID=2171554 RepID=UPI000D3E33C1|nr:hypothetical protein [Peribacillus acanthi]
MNINKNLTPIVALGVGIAGVSYLSRKTNRDKTFALFTTLKNKYFRKNDGPVTTQQLIQKGGHPDPHDIEDNKMVDEGAMYSVHYYNKNEHQ